jgi:hypothetical protein
MIMARAAWLHRPFSPGLPAITMPSHSKGMRLAQLLDPVDVAVICPWGQARRAQLPGPVRIRRRPAISHPCPADQDGDASDTCRS